ncbi:MAG: extracellular solute-binding protein [Anaerolineaceae bacterium]|nr:extracellular solute-binding protein [Anaerolineaceae bacterium]
MKKNTLLKLTSLVMVLAFVLAACAPAATTTPAVPPTQPPVQEQPTQPPAASPTAVMAQPTTPPATGGEKPTLSITWFEWPPCDNMQKLVDQYPDATVKMNCVPLARWHDEIFQGYIGKAGSDLVVGDSQWTGEEVKGNHILELTDWMKQNTPFDDYVPAALSAYGEYPPSSGKYYGAPIMADVQLLVYNKNIFQANGLTVPTTWDELLKGAQKVKAAGKNDGFVWFWDGSSDTLQSAWNQLAWSWGGQLWDPKTYKIAGIINSPENIAATDFAASLLKTGPQGSGSWGYNEVVDAICTGKAAMTSIWVGFASSFTDPKGCKESANLDFAVPPAGPKDHVLQLGGMGISISSYTKNKDAAFAFLKWLESKDTQLNWVKLGGYSAEKAVLASDTFQKAFPYNNKFAEAYQLVRDFWNIPEYAQLLTIQGKYLNLAVTGQMSSKDALDAIAKEQQAVIDQAYPSGPPK